ncbi:flagellin lysine-N-methylase [Ruminococcus flavefaciens]|uniref:Lysine-N-methylase n=1 Tax=Ruminococcus flavefaciens TaxID=1265 RepID=A0A1M7KDU7_RUMFL|nr:flagellin lysine-N-methylase [Ruminococcus flavefaciens]SHM63438.1 lysine-N-methylase [Ruminococcus flavefaciens]
MIYRTPEYCKDFRCIADKCKDSCCKGWEIDIDEDTARYYDSVGGEFGKRLKENIRDGCFVLTEDERCPFLNKQGLCDIYTELGEDKLCRICSDHPRYFEWFDGLKEGGTGLCCEAAAELILSRPFSLSESDIHDEGAAGDYDEELFELIQSARGDILDIIGNEDIPLADALSKSLDIAAEVQESIDIPFPDNENDDCGNALNRIFGCFCELEPIDENWLPYIKGCADSFDTMPAHNNDTHIYLRRIAQYLVFRYLLKSVYDGEILGYTKFAAVSVIVIARLFRYSAVNSGCCTISDCAETAKNYSKETEYCEENMEKLLELFADEPFFSISALKKLLTEELS